MPDQAVVYMGVKIKPDDPDPVVVPQPVVWTTPTGAVVQVVPNPDRVWNEDGSFGAVYGFPLNGRYFSKIIDKVDPNDKNEGGDGYMLVLDLDQLVALRASVRLWFPGADVIVTTEHF